jgi:nucleoside-diphosphate-sugar epimerase
VLDSIDDDTTMLEHAPMRRLAEGDHLMAYYHHGFWQCMDFPSERAFLEKMWLADQAPWATWFAPEAKRPTIPLTSSPDQPRKRSLPGRRVRTTKSRAPNRRRVLVTGHAGYLGRVLVPKLIDAGHHVCGLDSGLYRGCGFADEDVQRLAPRVVTVPSYDLDIRDITEDILHGFDTVIHLAGLCNDPLGDLDPNLTLEINHQAAVNLAAKARAAGVTHFLQASTCSIYGGSDDDWLDEDSPPRPLTPYAESKLFVERDVRRLADGSFCPTFFRMGTVFGWSPMLRGDLVVNNLVAYAATTGKILLKSLGTSWRPLLHVEDAANAFCTALNEHPAALGNVILNIGSTKENYQIHHVAEMIQQELPETEIVFADGAVADKRNYRVCCDRLRQFLPSYRTQWTVAAGIRQLVAAYRTAELTAEAFHSHLFMRLRHIQESQGEGVLNTDLRRVDFHAPPRRAA